MEQLFFADPVKGIEKKYKDLLSDINERSFEFRATVDDEDIYQLYLRIIRSMLFNRQVIFEDTVHEDTGIIINNTQPIPNLDELIIRIGQNTGWSLGIATSGTTGLPKKVTHTFASLTRTIKQDATRQNDVWALAYNPKHMAGLQVFFQALLNKNTIVNLFGAGKEKIFKSIETYGISHISATPTFYKLLLPDTRVFPGIKQVTFGGEKFNSFVQEALATMFPAARFTNVYASTEAGSLFSSQGNSFSIREKNQHFVKIMDDELYIHSSILASSEDIVLKDGWYATGDMVEIISHDPLSFVFLSRKNEMINVGGSKVNPNEVEEKMLLIEGVKDVKVYGRPSSLMGNILCADIVKQKEDLNEKDIKIALKESFPDYKIPRIIKFVDTIAMTNTGKKSRI